ncbi:AAA family ATPase, partial [Klebsiella pneumoniae]|uniref:AAA family ATPase n=1 Tax=Klebsiella pneumoniae TaxID=573 RepID=UPI003853DF8A
QDHALKSVAAAVLESRAGLSKPGQPIGSFFFLGPTGTGKTELGKSIAEFLFGDENAMIRFDMSEFKEEHSVALLYGAPPGYVGYEEGGKL